MTKRVLIARLDNDGDVLLTGPAVRAVAAAGCRVSYLCSPRAKPAATLLPGVSHILTFDAPWIAGDPVPVDHEETLALVGRVAALDLDEAVILTSFHQSPLPLALLLRMAWVPVIAAISVDYPGTLLNIRHSVAHHVHEVERNLSVVATLGYRLPPGDDGRLQIVSRADAEQVFDAPKPYVVVHPGASVPARAWFPDRNAATVAALADAGWHVVVSGSASEKDLAEHVAGPERPEVTNVAGTTDLNGLAALVAGAACLVVGNTGPAHLAAAVGTPVVSLFAPTVPAVQWRPWKVPHVLLGHQDIGCAGCRSRICPVAEQPCIGTVAVEEVLAAVDRLTGGPTPWVRTRLGRRVDRCVEEGTG